MTRLVATLLTLTLAACGSASSAGPKTSNPPLKAEPPKPAPDPAERPAVEQDGLTLKLNHLACRITMTPAPWKGSASVDDKGTAHLVLMRPDLEGAMDLHGAIVPGTDAKSIAEGQRALMAKDPDFASVSAALDEGRGRYAVIIEMTKDGNTTRGYFAIVKHPAIPDAYLIANAFAPAAPADAFFKEVRAVLDTLAPL